MSPLALLEASIIKADWAGVCEVYKVLTGNTLKPPGSPTNTNIPKLAKLLEQAMSLLQDEVPETVIIGPVSSKTKVVAKKAPGKVVKKTTRRPEPEPDPEPDEDEIHTSDDEGEDDEGEFAVDEDDGGTKGEVRCRSMPFRIPKGPNKFKDDGTIVGTFLGAGPEELAKESQAMSSSARLKQKKASYRPRLKTVKMKCTRCPRTESVPQGIVSAKEYVCNSCSAAAGFRG
jgi:hypothetical protein